MVAVATTYVFFLLFAQFGFLALLRERQGAEAIEPVIAVMGLSGLVTSLLTPLLLQRVAHRHLLRAGFVGCAVAAGTSAACQELAPFAAVAALAGGSCGLLTVSLAARLRALLGPRCGWKAGWATGLAYLFCNLPGVFDGPPARQAALSAAASLLGLAAVGWMHDRPMPPCDGAATRSLFQGQGFLGVVLALFGLIWLDSTAFGVIQETPGLKLATWGGAAENARIGACHALGALLAGWLLDRGAFRSLLVSSCTLFLIAITALQQGVSSGFAGRLYAIAVSIYSVALVVFPSARDDEPGLLPARWRAALLFGISGWIGSAAGVGLARELHAVPAWLLGTCAAMVLVAIVLARGGSVRALLRQHALTFVGALAALAFHAAHSGGAPPAAAEQDAVARGRRVYIDEGCINCHSQYVRPTTEDLLWWGPRLPADPQATPPLIGNRRQGPDLATAGLRRSAEWHRLHLIDPRLLSPGSKMPSYAHLFSADDSRGEDLVAYVSSLGAAEVEARAAWAARRPTVPYLETGDRDRGAALFDSACRACHGPTGRGDGVLAGRFDREWLNLHKDRLWLVQARGAEPEEQVLARLIRFGLIGGSMPGHEYWTDRELADVVAYVRSLGESGTP
jgi:cytochrome c oxidase cbb3-type subunit 2